MIKRILYSIHYRLGKLNFQRIEGKNNHLENNGIIQGCTVEIYGDNNRIIIGQGCIIRKTHFYIKGTNANISIGQNVHIKEGQLVIEDNGGNLFIGNSTTIEDAHIAVTEDNSLISIGKDCMIARKVEIRNGDSHAIIDNHGNRFNYAKNVSIEDHVWIGNDAKILKGAYLAENCIVGAGTITSGTFKNGCLIVGVPGKVVKNNINWTRERK